jgi:hypothetical protein
MRQPNATKSSASPHATRETRMAFACEAEGTAQRLQQSRSLGALRAPPKCGPPARPMRVIASDQPPFTSSPGNRLRQTPVL